MKLKVKWITEKKKIRKRVLSSLLINLERKKRQRTKDKMNSHLTMNSP